MIFLKNPFLVKQGTTELGNGFDCNILLQQNPYILSMIYGPTQVKSRLLSSSIFDAMNFQHFLEMLEIMLQHF